MLAVDTPIEITIQGAPVVNNACIVAISDNLVAITVDLHSKRCEIAGYGGDGTTPVVWLDATEDSLHLHESNKGITEISFPEFKGWDIWCLSTGRYSVELCLLCKEETA